MKRRGPQWVGAAIALLTATACGSSSSQSAVSDPSESPVEFQRQVVQVSSVDPDVSSSQIERCVWVAATSDQRRQGLMGVTSLGEVVQGGLAEFGVDESTIVSLTEDSCFATTMAE